MKIMIKNNFLAIMMHQRSIGHQSYVLKLLFLITSFSVKWTKYVNYRLNKFNIPAFELWFAMICQANVVQTLKIPLPPEIWNTMKLFYLVWFLQDVFGVWNKKKVFVLFKIKVTKLFRADSTMYRIYKCIFCPWK